MDIWRGRDVGRAGRRVEGREGGSQAGRELERSRVTS